MKGHALKPKQTHNNIFNTTPFCRTSSCRSRRGYNRGTLPEPTAQSPGKHLQLSNTGLIIPGWKNFRKYGPSLGERRSSLSVDVIWGKKYEKVGEKKKETVK
jgi:hypothetical protein